MVNLPDPPPYSYETGKTSSSVNWKVGAGNGRSIKGITIHHWGSSMNLNFDGIVNFLVSPRPSNPTSAHYVAQGRDENGKASKRVACIVDPEDIAYACGNWTGNLTTISIECRPNCSPDDLEVIAQLIARLRNQYGDLPLYPHSKWVSTECPGDNYRAQLTWLSNRANAILKGTTPVPATPTPAPKPAPVDPRFDDARYLITGAAVMKNMTAADPDKAPRVTISKGVEDAVKLALANSKKLDAILKALGK